MDITWSRISTPPTLPNHNDPPAMDGAPISVQGNGSAHDSCHAVDTEFLIVGAGPAGAALACFLGSHGMYLHLRAGLLVRTGLSVAKDYKAS